MRMVTKILLWLSGANVGAAIVYYLNDETKVAVSCAAVGFICLLIALVAFSRENEEIEEVEISSERS